MKTTRGRERVCLRMDEFVCLRVPGVEAYDSIWIHTRSERRRQQPQQRYAGW